MSFHCLGYGFSSNIMLFGNLCYNELGNGEQFINRLKYGFFFQLIELVFDNWVACLEQI